MNIKRKHWPLSVVLGALLVLSSPAMAQQKVSAQDRKAAADLEARIASGGTIYVGTEGTYPPFTYHDSTGRLTGYDVEVIRAVGKKLGVKVEFKETRWDAMLAGLNNHRFDVVANQVALTSPERRAKYDITDRYSYSGMVVVTRKDDNRVKDWSDIRGLRAAQGYTGNYTERAKALGAKIVFIDGLVEAMTLIKQNRADVTMNDSLAIKDLQLRRPDFPVKVVLHYPIVLGSGFVFTHGNKKTIDKFNKAIRELKADGTIKKISESFFGEDISNP